MNVNISIERAFLQKFDIKQLVNMKIFARDIYTYSANEFQSHRFCNPLKCFSVPVPLRSVHCSCFILCSFIKRITLHRHTPRAHKALHFSLYFYFYLKKSVLSFFFDVFCTHPPPYARVLRSFLECRHLILVHSFVVIFQYHVCSG